MAVSKDLKDYLHVFRGKISVYYNFRLLTKDNENVFLSGLT